MHLISPCGCLLVLETLTNLPVDGHIEAGCYIVSVKSSPNYVGRSKILCMLWPVIQILSSNLTYDQVRQGSRV